MSFSPSGTTDPPASEMGPGAAESLGKRFDALLSRLESAAGGSPGELAEKLDSLGDGIKQLQERFDAGLKALDAAMQAIARQEPSSAPDAAPCPPSAAAAGGDWQSALLGCDLADRPALGSQRRRLLDGVLERDPAASALIGLLLLFRSAAPEKMPALLKDIGEAYYRWRPQIGGDADEMEQSLVASLLRSCEQAGISNTIELVHPGERFDAARHSASERGVEVVRPLGWIVLRDNGKVYTKASVAVK